MQAKTNRRGQAYRRKGDGARPRSSSSAAAGGTGAGGAVPGGVVPPHLRRLGQVLDSAIPLPGGYRIGVDGLLGLIPGFGDAAGAALSGYIISQAARLGVPWVVLARMIVNVAIDSLVGLIPVAGDLFDFAWKANLRNLTLLDGYLDSPRAVRKSSTGVVVAVVVILVLVFAAIIGLGVLVLRALWQLGTAG